MATWGCPKCMAFWIVVLLVAAVMLAGHVYAQNKV